MPTTVHSENDFGLSEYDREIVDLLIWRKYRFSYIEAQRGSRLKLLEDAQRAVDPKLTERKMMTILRNPACKRYARHIKDNMREAAMKRLKDVVPEVVDDYFWARESARKAEDYKETRLAATDHLDRVGISEKPPTQVAQVAVIQLHARNYSTENLLAETPAVEGEAVEQPKEGESDATPSL